MSHFEEYSMLIRERGNYGLADAISKTVNEIIPRYVRNFSYKEHVVSLLMGNIQSGKTSHMFGLMSAAADEGFSIFVVLTTDNILLQQQTLERAESDLKTFCVCGEDDYLKFVENRLRKPSIIVLKKNGRVLRQWKNNFTSTNFCAGNPLFIVDDEADVASLNTLVNRRRLSTINKLLNEIKKTSSSSIYMQVTGTPQAILLQTVVSGWKPHFIYYFEPGRGYLGGDFFFASEKNPYVLLTDNDEAKEILEEDEFPENYLKLGLLMHLITSAHIFITQKDSVCNFMIHPSVRVSEHVKYAEKIGDYLNELSTSIEDECTIESLRNAYDNLLLTKSDLIPFEEVYNFIVHKLTNDEVSVLVLNSISDFESNATYNKGINIIVGGNSLGRGVTFPKLQTIYYCRQSKNPQADTMWQHSRMFGYDRIPELMRVFMPPILFKLFSDINKTNNALISQIKRFRDIDSIKMYYPLKLRPTRKNVIDNSSLNMIAGGVNYFPFYPINVSIETLDSMLTPFSDEGYYTISLKMLLAILQQVGSETDEWNKESFISFVNTYIAQDPSCQGILIVRRNRDITKGTGTLLSPNDRALGERFTNNIVITMYKVTGIKGWNGQKIWIPNIKFPNDLIFYEMTK
jgi:Z1 domain.